MIERKCQCCGVDISSKRKTAVFCSEYCGNKLRGIKFRKKDTIRRKQTREKNRAELTELDALETLEGIFWMDGVNCPFCQSDQYYELRGESCRLGLKKCAKCRKEFTVRHVIPEFKRSRLSYSDLLYAIDDGLKEFFEENPNLLYCYNLDRKTGSTRKTSLKILEKVKKGFY